MLWWLSKKDFPFGKPILTRRRNLHLASNASWTGWGAVYLDVQTGGP
jgi:hypothetical protein